LGSPWSTATFGVPSMIFRQQLLQRGPFQSRSLSMELGIGSFLTSPGSLALPKPVEFSALRLAQRKIGGIPEPNWSHLL
jgi:hypothetical protein